MWLSRGTLSLIISALLVKADGPTCSQSGLGPADMMMSNGAMNPKYMWENVGGTIRVPVVLDHAYSHKEKKVIYGGLAEMASKTCVRFYVFQHPSEVHDGDYVYISKTKSQGCWSYVGKQGGAQDLSLPRGCINHRTVVHEMMHALGFSHEHVRADRDKYVRILWENIQRGRERNFERKKDSKSDAFGPYDYTSIMHYDKHSFSSNGHDTIKPLKGFASIGTGKQMSHWDAKKINRLYKCDGHGGYHHGGSGGGGGGPGFGFGGDFGPPENSGYEDAPRSFFGFDRNHNNNFYNTEDNASPVNFVPNRSYNTNPFAPFRDHRSEHRNHNIVESNEVEFSPVSPFPSYHNNYYY